MNLETRMQKYHGEARDGGYVMTPLHVADDGRVDGSGWKNLDH